MLKQDEMLKQFRIEFTPPQATLLARVITDAYTDLVKTSDFNELKAIVAELAAAQQRTELRMGELAEAQQHTEQRMDELAVAQQRTELAVQALVRGLEDTRIEVGKLAQGLTDTRVEVSKLGRKQGDTSAEVGGLSRSVSYALENEAYRALPAFLASRYDIRLTDRFIRTELDGEEINFFGHANQDGEAVIIVGEVKLRLDDRRKVEREAGGLRSAALVELERKLAAVRHHYPGVPLVPLLVTHYARPIMLQEATAEGVIVVQSFEW